MIDTDRLVENSISEKLEESTSTNYAQSGLDFISKEAVRADKEFRRFSYKHPLAVLVSGLALGFATHWVLNESKFRKSE